MSRPGLYVKAFFFESDAVHVSGIVMGFLSPCP